MKFNQNMLQRYYSKNIFADTIGEFLNKNLFMICFAQNILNFKVESVVAKVLAASPRWVARKRCIGFPSTYRDKN